MYSQNQMLKIVVAAMFTLTALLLPLTASADGGATVSLNQIESAEGTMQVEVVVDDVTNLYGMEFELAYDPTVLTVQDAVADQPGVQIEAGDFLPISQGFMVANQVEAESGTIILAATLLNPAPPVSGSGVLARINFDVLNDYQSRVAVQKLNLVSSEMAAMPVQTSDLSFGTVVATEGEGGTGMWLILAIGVVVVLIIGLSVGVMLMGKSKPQAETPQPQAQTAG